MKFSYVLPLVTLTVALVIPDDKIMGQVAIGSHRHPDSVFHKLPSKEVLIEELDNTFSRVAQSSKNALDVAIETTSVTVDNIEGKLNEAYFDSKAWLDAAYESFEGEEKHGDHGHRHGPRHGKPHHKPNKTVYELIAESKYTTKLAGLINQFDDLVELLNGTEANYTVFAPTDKAFERIPEHAPKPSKEILKRILTYHVSADFYPAGRVLISHTIPSLLLEDRLGGAAQRLSTNIGLKGLTVNFYSRVVAVDIFGTNGVIHGVDSLILPPPKAAAIISLLPGEFSTLELALVKTGLDQAINDTSNHVGGTLFAPSNFAFQKLGPKINGFLFSRFGQKYLKALLLYHVVANQTLYSDWYEKSSSVVEESIPKGYFHIDLPTLLGDRSLSIDIARYGRLIEIKINGFSRVVIQDGVAKDGVIHVIGDVLIPPKQVRGLMQEWNGEELSEADLIERLEPLVEKPEL